MKLKCYKKDKTIAAAMTYTVNNPLLYHESTKCQNSKTFPSIPDKCNR